MSIFNFSFLSVKDISRFVAQLGGRDMYGETVSVLISHDESQQFEFGWGAPSVTQL